MKKNKRMLAQNKNRTVTIHRKEKRSWDSSETTRLTGAFKTVRDINSEITSNLDKTRSRVRAMIINNPYAARYIAHCVGSLISDTGMQFMATPLNMSGKIDKAAARIVQDAFRSFQKHLYVGDKYNMVNFQQQMVKYLESDGECFIRKVLTDTGVRFVFIDPTDVDHTRNTSPIANGTRIVNGVHVDKHYVVRGYHLYYTNDDCTREYVPADEMIHIFKRDSHKQTRGIPPLSPVLDILHQLDEYQKAELINKRISASKMGFLVQNELGNGLDYDEDDEGVVSHVEPGSIERLPLGFEFQQFDPKDTSTNYKEYTSELLKKVASALSVNHFSLTSDYGSVNYSSARFGSIVEGEVWASKQALIETALSEMYLQWLAQDLFVDNIYLKTLPATPMMFDKLSAHKWTARQRKSVDPGKEAKGYAEQIQSGISTLTDVLLDLGKNPDDHFEQLAADIARCKSIGLDYATAIMKMQPQQQQAAPAEDEE